jgi:hypothetical protein
MFQKLYFCLTILCCVWPLQAEAQQDSTLQAQPATERLQTNPLGTPATGGHINSERDFSALEFSQVLAAFASLGALLFLLWQNLQLRKQAQELTRSIRSSSYQNIVSLYTDINKSLMLNSELAEAFDSLDQKEPNNDPRIERRRQWLSFWLLNHYENAYMQHRLAALPVEMWRGIEADCLYQLERPYVRNLWRESSHLFSKEFQGFITRAKPNILD